MSCVRAYEYHILNTVPSTITRGASSTASSERSLDSTGAGSAVKCCPSVDDARPISATLPPDAGAWLAEKNMM